MTKWAKSLLRISNHEVETLQKRLAEIVDDLVGTPTLLADTQAVERQLEESTQVERFVFFDQDETFEEFKDAAERTFLLLKLREFDWNVSETARALDMPRSNLYKKIERYALVRESA